MVDTSRLMTQFVPRPAMRQATLISVVVPCYNESGNIHLLYSQLLETFHALEYGWELIFVDDGSTDCTSDIIRELHLQDPRVKLITLSRNFGHQIALTAGMEHAQGDAVITMDADLQHPPSLIADLINHWEQGFDVVYTIRESTDDSTMLKKCLSWSFYRIINCFTDTKIIPNVADFRLLDRKVVECLNRMREQHRFLRGMTSWVGFRQTAVHFRAPKRHSGAAKYTFRKMVRFALNGITAFSSLPLRLATILGFLAALSGVPYGIWALYAKLVRQDTVPGWSSLIIAILFLGGVQLICLGILGEYVGRIYDEVKGRPVYLVQERLGFDDRESDRHLYVHTVHRQSKHGQNDWISSTES